ncbi:MULTISPECIES: hypothetical protein [unclassified Clostridium]|uniref:hypothetical protein n=1 Tax=unclassified Clostridium TaxID=2614128 RepID=UPI0032180754
MININQVVVEVLINVTYIILLFILMLVVWVFFKDLSKRPKEKSSEVLYKFWINYYKVLALVFIVFSIIFISNLMLKIIDLLT